MCCSIFESARLNRVFLAIDVGNSETKLGFFARKSDTGAGELTRTWRVTTERRCTTDEFTVLFASLFASAGIALSEVRSVVISSVVPQNDRELARACEQCFKCSPRFFTAARQNLLAIRTERPKELGSDLAAAAIAACALYGTPAIAVGFGTATTFGAVARDGAYAGAAIAPGIQISIDALVARTAKLPHVALEAPDSSIGTDTITALQSGIVYGFVAQTEGMIARMRRELGKDAKVVATGGLADIVARHTDAIDHVEPHLVLLGLHRYAESLNAL
jgi:type III pantothenate kinase